MRSSGLPEVKVMARRTSPTTILVAIAAAVVGHAVGLAYADIPTDTKALAYTGVLEQGSVPVDAQLAMQVRLYTEDSGGASPPVCSTDPAKTYAVTKGRFSIPLPDACVAAVRLHGELYAELTVAGGPPMQRTILRAVPYAVQAASADNGVPPGMIGMFESDCPPGWDRLTELDDFFLKGGATFGIGQSSDTTTATIPAKLTSTAKPSSAWDTAHKPDDGQYCPKDTSGNQTFVAAWFGSPWRTGEKGMCMDHQHTLGAATIDVKIVPKHYTVLMCEFKGCSDGPLGNAANCH